MRRLSYDIDVERIAVSLVEWPAGDQAESEQKEKSCWGGMAEAEVD